ncbi:hypothetical protein [Methylobacillus flagellatus]|uniref:hypothetical protein n=1 Tax=Methylobacillus flagellatus TaxID=405 RepID=UPI0010F7FD1F|nr:hypothetical protein [Methylobacillus flagellatus]
MKAQHKQWLLYGGLSLTLLAAWLAPSTDSSSEASAAAQRQSGAQPAIRQSASTPASVSTTLSAQRAWAPQARTLLEQAPADLFLLPEAASTEQEAMASASTAETRAPVAPALPYAYMGKMQQADEMTVFISREQRPYIVRAGDVVDGEYRVERIAPPYMHLTYLPLQQAQTLFIGVHE